MAKLWCLLLLVVLPQIFGSEYLKTCQTKATDFEKRLQAMTKYDDKLGKDIAGNLCDFISQAGSNTDTKIAALYKDPKIPSSITGDKRAQVVKVLATNTNIVHSDISDIVNVECPNAREVKDRIARLTDFKSLKERMIKFNANVRLTCENWDKKFDSILKTHTDNLPEIYANPQNQRFGVVDFDAKGLDTFYAGLVSAAGKSPMDKFNDGWKKTVQQIKAKTKEVQGKIDTEGTAARARVNAIKKISPEKKTACLKEIDDISKESKEMLDHEIELIETSLKENTADVKEDFEKNPKAVDPFRSTEARRVYNIAAVSEKGIAADALYILFTNCRDASK